MPKYRALLEAFPERAMQIRRAILNNHEFATICDDYLACLAALDHWKTEPDPNRRAEEYETVLVEIKAEIESFLSSQNR